MHTRTQYGTETTIPTSDIVVGYMRPSVLLNFNFTNPGISSNFVFINTYYYTGPMKLANKFIIINIAWLLTQCR